jgi:hypothetical protein
MSHSGTVNQAFLNKRTQSRLKSDRALGVETWKVIPCAEDKGNRKAAAVFGVDESNVRLWRKHNAAISGREALRRKFTGPKKGQCPEVDDAVFALFFSRETQVWTVCEL